jgi:hypothetical protein
MSRRSLSLPLTLIAAFAALLILLMAGVLPSAVLVAQTYCPTAGFPSNDPVYPGLSYPNCKATQQAGQEGPSATNTTSSGGNTGGNSQPAQATITSTITRTVTITAGTAQATATLAATVTPTLTRAPVQDAPPSATPTSELPEGVEALACVPGETLRLTGEAEPGAALLAYFADRPVGGGFARADGQFTIDLLIGEERPGFYLVEVRERTTRALVTQVGCEVPAFTPTPTRIIAP